MTPAILPLSPALLRAAAAAASIGAAEVTGIRQGAAHVFSDGQIGWTVAVPGFPRAIEEVARTLEDVGYAVRRGRGVWVIGVDAWGGRPMATLDPWHPAKAARSLRHLRERAERDAAVAPGVDMKRQAAEARDASAYGRTGT